jgi:hypothetical protein
MSELKYTMLSKDTRPIVSIILDADYQTTHNVGRYGVTKISVVDENGEMAHVPWFEVWKDDALYARVNSKYVSEVLYQEGQPKRSRNA